MNLHELIDQYVSFRKSLGYRCHRNERHLRSFGRRFSVTTNVDEVRSEDVSAFLDGSGPITSSWHVKYSALSGLFRYAVTREYLTTAPVPTVVPKRPPPFVPYIYSLDELRRILDATASYQRHRSSMEPTTVRTVVLLLYGAGLRVGEALRLGCCDVDFDGSLLTVRQTKCFKTRIVPIGPVLLEALRRYSASGRPLGVREGQYGTFFTMRTGEPVKKAALQSSFRRVCKHGGVKRVDGAQYEPRLVDLRHSFAVHRLTSWYRQGVDVQMLLPRLSVYMGHVSIASTQAYLTMTPELLKEATKRFAQYATEGTHHEDNN